MGPSLVSVPQVFKSLRSLLIWEKSCVQVQTELHPELSGPLCLGEKRLGENVRGPDLFLCVLLGLNFHSTCISHRVLQKTVTLVSQG